MYGGSGKLGRGGGAGRGAGGGNKRNIHSTFHTPPLHRPSSAGAAASAPISGGRLSMGGGGAAQRNRVGSGSATTAASSAATEESFRLVTEDPLNFAMIIRLAPDLVEEIKRVESQGSRARIKFDANANNSSGNVISVGGKDFRFTWSRETGDLCDIYEERRSGDDGNGLLVESGSAWRKLNVQRVLDESTQNHVKMRSEEAERKLKSRKAIVLDHGNPLMKNNVKAMVAAESTSSWRMKGAPFKKRKAEPPPGGPPKSVQRSGLTTTPPSKGRPPALSPSSPPEQSLAPGSPVGAMKGHTEFEDTVSTLPMNRTVGSEKDATARAISNAGRGKLGQKALKGAQMGDLRSMLISLLGENPSKAKSLKALEKAIGDAIPNSVKQIEPILKKVRFFFFEKKKISRKSFEIYTQDLTFVNMCKIATYQAPGNYVLKPGIEIEGSKKPPVSESQSSPEDNHHLSPVQDGRHSALDNIFSLSSEPNELERPEPANKFEEANNLVERVDVSHQVADLFGEKKVSDNSEGPVGSSSDSGSDSDSESESSDSGSDSETHSRSRSRSAGGSGTGSSSDSDSDDASTKSKEPSDEDVDIMTSDDDKQVKHQLETTMIGTLWGNLDGEHASMLSEEKQDGHVSDLIEIERDFPEDQPVGGMAAPSDSVRNPEGHKAVDKTAPPSYSDHEKHEFIVKNYGESGNDSKDGVRHGHSDSSEKSSRGKYKRALEEKLEDKPDRGKKLKSGNSQQLPVSGSRAAAFQASHQNASPNRPFEDLTTGPNNQVANRSRKEINSRSGSHKSYDQTSLGKSMSDSQHPIQKSIDSSSRIKTSIPAERQGKHSENIGRGSKQIDKLHQATDGLSFQKDKLNREMPDVYASSGHKGLAKVSKEDFLEKQMTPADTQHRKHEAFGNSKDVGSILNSPRDENLSFRERSAVNERPNVLQRELSDLELGELRESLPEEQSGLGKQLNRKNSFKQSENWKPDSSKARLGSKSSPNVNMDGVPKRGISEHVGGENSKHQPRGMQNQHPRFQSRNDYVDNVTKPNKAVESSGRNRRGDAGTCVDATPEANGSFPGKGLPTISQEHETRQLAAASRKDSRRQTSNAIPDLNDKQKDFSLTGSSDGSQRRIESSSDENSCPYSKYEKDEPEFKGPIKDHSQYQEYVDEFQEKYPVYASLNKTLEAHREEFVKYENDLMASKGKDMERYYAVERQIRESYRRCGERVKRLKKTFLVLHEELKVINFP
ncbi:OLC1v1014960C1 [Oldenlandia corymbosa var. corymbosa]|uniref:OLC1v1014960C1 n=1 Tax=Oldenlandia corymbosa var. corymbosa TaxID=529605 RepID=A0AAV1E266_OLDCO|nr:OLC1v1014960C1 [Oldenlandia corymbosa var. corymbosa]